MTETTTGAARNPRARKVAISRVRVATAAYMLLSAPNTAPIPMMMPMALPSAVISRVRAADCAV